MIVFILLEKRRYGKLYGRWFGSRINMLTDGYDLNNRRTLALPIAAAEGKYCRQVRSQKSESCKDTDPLNLDYKNTERHDFSRRTNLLEPKVCRLRRCQC